MASIGGSLTIALNHALASLTGLEALAFIGGSLTVVDNDQLVNVSALAALQTVGGDVYMQGNAALPSLTGFEALALIGGSLSIVNNDQLVNVSALADLRTVGGDVLVRGNQLSNVRVLCGIVVNGTIEIHIVSYAVPYINFNYCESTHVFADEASLRTAVSVWCANSAAAEEQYGDISRWDVLAVTDMSSLFRDCQSSTFADLRGWETRGVTRMDVR